MPGFKILPSMSDGREIPSRAVYTYTWKLNVLGNNEYEETSFYPKSVTPPSFSYSTMEFDSGHAVYEIPKSRKWNDIKVVLYDVHNTNKDIHNMVYSGWSRDKGLKPVSGLHVGDSVIEVAYNTGEPAYTWNLFNSWIKAVSSADLTYESSGVNQLTITVGYTWADIVSH